MSVRAERNRMRKTVRSALWNRAVALLFGLPAIGYLAFLSQFVLGDLPGVVEDVLAGLFLFALPVTLVYSAVLDVIGPVGQTLGTVGFFPFAYLLAVVFVFVTRQAIRFVRRYVSSETGFDRLNS